MTLLVRIQLGDSPGESLKRYFQDLLKIGKLENRGYKISGFMHRVGGHKC